MTAAVKAEIFFLIQLGISWHGEALRFTWVDLSKAEEPTKKWLTF